MMGFRKYSLAAFASISALVLCWSGHLAGGHWVAAQSIILGLYKAADVMNRRSPNANTQPQDIH